ncbi:MAG: Bacterial antitoxin of ParD toxin-antitoxin type system [Caulobacteraceae bacterium]|nr:Bacterial antitoxin of ParD toxin-antitoxin type system [Caulobacteraceae bacterium]
MTALRVTLDAELDRFVADQVRSGAYPDAESVVRAGLVQLRADDVARDSRYRAMLLAGLDELDGGQGLSVSDVDGFMEGLGQEKA